MSLKLRNSLVLVALIAGGFSSAGHAQTIPQAVDSVTANITGGVSQLRGQILSDQTALDEMHKTVAGMCAAIHVKEPTFSAASCPPVPMKPETP